MSGPIDFYPTPPGLVSRMLDQVDWRYVSNALEPSAGKGDLADAIKRSMESIRGSRSAVVVDCIELDPNLQHILLGKGHNVIHDDFLTFRTVKQYDTVVANFPFSEGDRHLLHAMRLLGDSGGGQLVALVNAETLRNPYTRDRQWLCTVLESIEAEITYLAGEFAHAERPTDVEVALVVAQIPRQAANDSELILTSLEDADEAHDVSSRPGDLVEVDPVQNMLARFDLECRAGVKLIAEYETLRPLMLDRLSLAQGDDAEKFARPIIELRIDTPHAGGQGQSNAYVRAIRHKYWHALIGNPQFRSSYTSAILKSLDRKLDQLSDKDFTLFNIRQLDHELRGELPSSIEDAILGLFDELSHRYAFIDGTGNNVHYYDGWKTNRAHKINRKCILPINGFRSWSIDRRDLDSRYITERLADIIKCFQYLEGRPVNAQEIALERVTTANETSNFRNLDCRYFTATFYRKGTCHITFTSQELLDKFNIFGSQRKGWLPPSYGRRRYRDMDPEERLVVDAFQGEAAYEAVLGRADYYLSTPGMPQLAMGRAA